MVTASSAVAGLAKVQVASGVGPRALPVARARIDVSGVNAPGTAMSGALFTLLATGAASSLITPPHAYDRDRDADRIAPLVLGASCPVMATASQHISAGPQHVSTGDIVPTTSGAAAKNGVLVGSGQTVFYAGPAPKGVDSASAKAKPAPVFTPAAGNVVNHPAAATHTVTPTHATRPSGKTAPVWTVQVASYETIDQAQTLEQTLCQKGYAARIVGTNKPFTVQVGAYPSSDSAMVVARRLSSRELTVFVTQWRH